MIRTRNIPPSRAAKLQKLIASRSKKTKASVSISADLLAAADELAGKSHRSEFFELAVRSMMRRIVRRARHERELAILNNQADALNAEADETLEFQAELEDE
jgi:metal-responsive CopG/Arc/MetJ family transcriptional regulator